MGWALEGQLSRAILSCQLVLEVETKHYLGTRMPMKHGYLLTRVGHNFSDAS
jgi:hypothetical protein